MRSTAQRPAACHTLDRHPLSTCIAEHWMHGASHALPLYPYPPAAARTPLTHTLPHLPRRETQPTHKKTNYENNKFKKYPPNPAPAPPSAWCRTRRAPPPTACWCSCGAGCSRRQPPHSGWCHAPAARPGGGAAGGAGGGGRGVTGGASDCERVGWVGEGWGVGCTGVCRWAIQAHTLWRGSPRPRAGASREGSYTTSGKGRRPTPLLEGGKGCPRCLSARDVAPLAGSPRPIHRAPQVPPREGAQKEKKKKETKQKKGLPSVLPHL